VKTKPVAGKRLLSTASLEAVDPTKNYLSAIVSVLQQKKVTCSAADQQPLLQPTNYRTCQGDLVLHGLQYALESRLRHGLQTAILQVLGR